MMEFESRSSEKFNGVLDDLSDELNGKPTDTDNAPILEESDEGEEMQCAADGEGKAEGFVNTKGRIIKKVSYSVFT